MLHHVPRRLAPALLILILAACGAPAVSTAPSTPVASTAPAAAGAAGSDLSGIKTYLLDSTAALTSQSAALKSASDRYYELAQAARFDYPALWQQRSADVAAALKEAKAAWIAASPGYERMEGIVAGVPSLAEYDVILDAGAAASEDPEGAVPFDLKLPDGTVLPKPGNLFGLTESALWGTRSEFVIAGVQPDLDGNGAQDFGEVLPDANMLKGAADTLDQYARELQTAAQSWQPTESDAFTALVVMIPTMSEYFESWKHSRFVAGEQSTQSDFAVISRLADIQDILSGLQVVYRNISPQVAQVDPAQDQQIKQKLDDLKTYVADLYTQEQGGKRFSAEEADMLGGEAQERATAVAGQISQVAAKLNIAIEL
jgi:hypothetical protein